MRAPQFFLALQKLLTECGERRVNPRGKMVDLLTQKERNVIADVYG